MIELDAQATTLVRDSYQPGTWSNITSQVSGYYRFCDQYGLQYLPASPQQLTRFAVFLFEVKKLSPDTISNHISTVRTLHGLAGLALPQPSTYVHNRVIAGMKNRTKKPTKQAVAVTPEMLAQIYHAVDFSSCLEMVTWVAILMGFHCLLRVSNLTAPSSKTFDCTRHLMRKDIRMHDNIMLVHIRWSKTLQYRERKLLIPVIPFSEQWLSAVQWFNYMISIIPAGPQDPAFAVPTDKGLQPLTYHQLSRLLRKWANMVNLDPKTMTSHCLRRGGASWLTERGVPDHIVQAIGDWRTMVFKKYIDQALRTRLQALVAFTAQNSS